MKDNFGVDGNGVIVLRADHTDPDEFSYNDDIRRKGLMLKASGGGDFDDGERDTHDRLHQNTFRLLGYPSFMLGKRWKLLHSFEEKFGEKFFVPPLDTMILGASGAVVSVSSFLKTKIGERRLFTCSGTVIESWHRGTVVVTSACLVSHSDDAGDLRLAKNFKIKVRFGHEEPCNALFLGCCLHYNIAFILTLESCKSGLLPLNERECLPKGNDVFALGRHYLSGSYMVASGRTTVKKNQFDCAEILYSSCKITKCGVGGPLVDSCGELVGINFYDGKDAPYLPICLVSKCWHHMKRYKKVIHPFLGWRLSAILQLENWR
ncbi:uncharacterized protein [Spinacia oleracea]|uniref:Uncharacterized protein isoform X2 n=1 Tax=Spinacia oleracea TaxID=3562 RepID=A0ABM3QVG2_SPIOL|nr:uncharacterized protein LOC110785323 isoform X2 [Spinacia oleracea]